MNYRKRIIIFITFLGIAVSTQAQEKIFAGYFDIATGSPSGTEVMGRIHIDRNKDVLTHPIPRTYQFAISKQKGDLFKIETRFDPVGRIMGIISTKNKINDSMLGQYNLSIVLSDGTKKLNEFPIIIKVVKETLWKTLYNRYKDVTLYGWEGRMHGKETMTDAQVAATINTLEKDNGKFKEYGFYDTNVTDYKAVSGKTIEFDWAVVANHIGALGYAYGKSKIYGPNGDSTQRARLKEVLYKAIIAYTESVPVEGRDVMIDGKPIGTCTGDGFSNLLLHGLINVEVATHQWIISDGLIAPSVQLAPAIQTDINKGNKEASRVYYDLVRFFQTAMAVAPNRRVINDPNERWGALQDTLRSAGAWADANLGHRSRMMLALPVIWADYNRPMTYVQYWYSSYYHDQPYKNFSFSPGWSPHGVAFDVARWMTKYNVPAHKYAQSGFQPDGTVSHHTEHGTDAVMVAYGFDWLTNCITGFNQFKNTDFELADKYYQFPADRLERVYPKIIYNGSFDFLVSGRNFLIDLKKFVSGTYLKTIEDLNKSRNINTVLTNQTALNKIYKEIKNNTYQYTGTEAFWVNEFLVHREGANEKPFYVSLKLKSKRTVGAEDFSKVRKSWYAGYGIMPLKVRGDEYSEKVLSNMDWHALPGLTEEWRTDEMPGGSSQASLPGDNDVAGVTANGYNGMGIYHHLPRETYSSATAFKSYHFTKDKIIALGSHIQRFRTGQGKDIVTTLDQSAFVANLSIFHDGKSELITPSQSVNIEFETDKPVWLHIAEKGYIIYPQGKQKILVKTGKEINITDKGIANQVPNYIIAIDHGQNPSVQNPGSYYYCLVPNVTANDMPAVTERYAKEILYRENDQVHAVYDADNKVYEAAFFKPGGITIAGMNIRAESPALFLLADNGNSWQLTISNPAPDVNKQQLILHTSIKFRSGKYDYMLGGIYPHKGEFVTISSEGTGSKIVVELPDKRDEAFYDYRPELYNAAPINIKIEK